MDTLIEYIEFSDSYILGWKYENNVFILFTELLLTENHPNWSKFDSKREYGCYKLGIFRFYQATSVSGINIAVYPLKRNLELDEYVDYAEIDLVEIKNQTAIFYLDTNPIEVNFSTFELEILDSANFI